MEISRKIERRITVTATEVYAALAKAHDLAGDPADYCFFDMDAAGQQADVTLVHISSYKQEVAA